MKNFIFITFELFMVVYIVNCNENSPKLRDNFGENLNNKRRQSFLTKDVKEKSLLEKLLEVKSNFENAKQIFKLLLNLKNNNRIIIFATHNRYFANMADCKIKMIGGKMKLTNERII